MSFAILRVEKLTSLSAVALSGKHNYREVETPNADPTVQNTHHLATSSAELVEAVRSRLPAKHRKDAVRCLEYLVTCSPEAVAGKTRDQVEAYLQDASRWLGRKHGNKRNVVGISVHWDETTPHLVMYVVPRTADGRLSAKEFIGSPAQLRKLQTDFAREVGAIHGLERGLEGSKATHTSVKRWYGQQTSLEAQNDALRAENEALRLENKALRIRIAALEPEPERRSRPRSGSSFEL